MIVIELVSFSCLFIMAILTQRLPICLIPEQPLISPVRDDVIDYCRGDDLALLLAENT